MKRKLRVSAVVCIVFSIILLICSVIEGNWDAVFAYALVVLSYFGTFFLAGGIKE